MNKEIRVSDLQILLDNYFGRGTWVSLEPETILIELKCREYLVAEKIYVLKVLNTDLNRALSSPEFLLWYTSVCNNEYADFETISLPTCLELAWSIYEAKKLASIIGHKFEPTEELIDIVSYLLTLEGFSHAPYPFDFIPETKLAPGQTEHDMKMKDAAILTYLSHMKGIVFTSSTALSNNQVETPIETSESSE